MRFKDLSFGQRFGRQSIEGPSLQKTNTYYDSAGNPLNTLHLPQGYLSFTDPESEVVAYSSTGRSQSGVFGGTVTLRTEEHFRYAH